MSDDDGTKLTQMIGTLRAIEKSANNGVHLVAGNGDISLELSLEEIETHVMPILQGWKASAGMELASKPKERAPLLVGSAEDGKTDAMAGWRY